MCNSRDAKPRRKKPASANRPLRGQARLPLGVPEKHSIREEYRKCGSPRCSLCPDGVGHPYRYAVWRDGPKVVRKYLGKA